VCRLLRIGEAQICQLFNTPTVRKSLSKRDVPTGRKITEIDLMAAASGHNPAPTADLPRRYIALNWCA
jgi:hypothetical protein